MAHCLTIKEISSATITYLIKLQENGYTLVLATGRFYELKPYIEQLQLENIMAM